MEINSNCIKLTGKSEISEPLEVGKNYSLVAQGSIVKSELHDNEDGTATQIFTFRPILSEVVKESGETVKVKDSRSMSQKLRRVLWGEWSKDDCGMDFDAYYEKEMGAIIAQRLI